MRKWKSTLKLTQLLPGDRIDLYFYDWFISAVFYRRGEKGEIRLMPEMDSELETFKGPNPRLRSKESWILLFRNRAIKIADGLAERFKCKAEIEKEASAEGMSFVLRSS